MWLYALTVVKIYLSLLEDIMDVTAVRWELITDYKNICGFFALVYIPNFLFLFRLMFLNQATSQPCNQR